MSAPGVTFQLLDSQLLDSQLANGRLPGRHRGAADDEYLALRADVYGAGVSSAGVRRAGVRRAGVSGDAAGEQARRFRVWRRQPGFALAAARHGGYLIGYACGIPLRPSTSWWKELTTPLPEDVTAEQPGRTFVLTDLAVRASWRRQGIAGSLCRLLMDGRPEERATATVPPDAAAAQRAFRNWGWHKVARTRGPAPDTPVLDVLLIPLAGQM